MNPKFQLWVQSPKMSFVLKRQQCFVLFCLFYLIQGNKYLERKGVGAEFFFVTIVQNPTLETNQPHHPSCDIYSPANSSRQNRTKQEAKPTA